MDLDSIETVNFEPREGVRESGLEYVKEVLQGQEKPGKAKIIIADLGEKFFSRWWVECKRRSCPRK